MKKEIKYYGLHACLEIWKRRPRDIIRVYIDPTKTKVLGSLLKWCAEQKLAYHMIPPEELAKVSESIHHEGICILAREPSLVSPDEFCREIERGSESICLLYLDGVQNPHNLGSILRTCAHFKILYILGEKDKLPALSPSACRIAKGGAEIVRFIALPKPIEILQWLKKKGFSIFGTSADGRASLYDLTFPSRAIFAIGSESDGLSRPLRSLVQTQVRIPGSGWVESLNVSVATALFLSEYRRQRP